VGRSAGPALVNDVPVSAEGSTNDERILGASKTKWLAMLLGSATFVAIGLLIVPRRPFLWVLIVFFGASVFMSFVALLPGTTYLRLTSEGYEQRAFFRTSKRSWRHIERFQAYRNPTSWNRRVGIIFDTSYKSHARARGFSRSLAGVDGALSDTYGLAADDLANLMNEWLNRYKRQ
jgi:hypothetical protein